MRAQDTNRRRPPHSDSSRETMSPKPMSSPRHSLTSSPSLPVRNIMQSASVCDLSAPNMWNSEMQQVKLKFSFLKNTSNYKYKFLNGILLSRHNH